MLDWSLDFILYSCCPSLFQLPSHFTTQFNCAGIKMMKHQWTAKCGSVKLLLCLKGLPRFFLHLRAQCDLIGWLSTLLWIKRANKHITQHFMGYSWTYRSWCFLYKKMKIQYSIQLLGQKWSGFPSFTSKYTWWNPYFPGWNAKQSISSSLVFQCLEGITYGPWRNASKIHRPHWRTCAR